MSASPSEPQAKRRRTSRAATAKFRDPNTLHDRVLLVEDQKFYVDSNVLIASSEYFRALFTGSFQENGQQEIKLNDISAIQLEKFLVAATNPEEIAWGRDALKDLIEVCSFLGSVDLVMKVMDIRGNFNRVKKEELLELAKEHGLTDLKNRVDEDSVKRFKRLVYSGQKWELFRIGVEYELEKLLDYVNDAFAFASFDNCSEVLAAYRLKDNAFFKKKIEKIEDALFLFWGKRGIFNGRTPWMENKNDHYKLIKQHQLENLAARICDILIAQFDSQPAFYHVANILSDFYVALRTPHFERLEAHISEYCKNKFEAKSENYILYIHHISQLPSFKEYLKTKLAGMRVTDPLIADNKDAFISLGKDERQFVMDNMLKD